MQRMLLIGVEVGLSFEICAQAPDEIRREPFLVPLLGRNQLAADGEVFSLRNLGDSPADEIEQPVTIGIGHLRLQLEKHDVTNHVDSYSSSSLNLARTEKSSSVVVSPTVA